MIKLKKILNNLPCAVIVVNEDRRVLVSNRVAREISRLSEAHIINKRGGDILGCVNADQHPDGCGFSAPCRFCKAKAAVVSAFETQGDVPPFELEMALKNVGPRVLKMTATFLPALTSSSHEAPAPLVIVTIDDITDLKHKEQLETAHATIGAVCHEMNQPLMVLMGSLEIMHQQPAASLLEDMLVQVRRLGDITRKMQMLNAYATKSYLNAKNRILDLSPPQAEVRITHVSEAERFNCEADR